MPRIGSLFICPLVWFSNQVMRKVGNGQQTSFWSDLWFGECSFKEKFPMLFQIAANKEALISYVSPSSTELGLIWLWSWRLPLFIWEDELLQ